ncbi:MAG TPA: G1 family glutamic endopeptidase [Chloroflexota bacterium]|nr:G1 family glutamic endopeptidase [Chloroflexota bacterium]
MDAPPAQSPPSPPPATKPRPTGSGGPQAGLAALLLAVAVFGGLIGFAADRWISANPNTAVAPVAAAAPTAVPARASTNPAAPSAPPASGAAAAPTAGTAPRSGSRAQQNGNGAAPTPAPTSAATATDPQQLAIQQVIEKGDREQQQAFTANDPTVMADSSTPDFYQQQVQINQDMKANGVTAIKLVSIEWGQISVSGGTATATAWETWTTTYSDGTTEQSRDRNLYTLVQDNGAWKVSADQHPDDPLSSPTGTSPAPTAPTTPNGQTAPGGQTQPAQPGQGSRRVTPSQPGSQTQPGGQSTPGSQTQPGLPGQTQPSQPRGQRGGNTNTSQNWSGYAATGGTFTAVSGTWTVPQFTFDSTAGADAAWVGIGGVNSTDLIQAGTQQTVSGSGSTQYQAWVETLPQSSHPVPLTINPGDSVTVSITQQPQSQTQWLIAMKNNTTGQTFEVTENYQSSMSSAEWIEEAPSAARGRQIPLDSFGKIDFTAGTAVKDGQTVSIAAAAGKAITMIGRGGQSQATPSGLGTDGASFTVSRG